MKLICNLLMLLFPLFLHAQIVCNPNGNLILYTNYEGGLLNINVDVNIPNLKIGVVSYESVQINLSGPFVNNVSAVYYAGYNNGINTACGNNITTTVINGAPVTATTSILFAPPVTLSNVNGYNNIICGYSCITNTYQGGCNTIDQIEAYFASVFPGSVLRHHRVQYNCWTGSQTITDAGTCCANPALPLAVSIASTQPTCFNQCNGTITAYASGGQSPYSYQWNGGPASASWTNRCSGTYTVTVTDAANNTSSSVVTLINPPQINATINQTSCGPHLFNGQLINQSGLYSDTLIAANGCDSILHLNLTIQLVDTGLLVNGIIGTATASNASYQWYNCLSQSIVNGATAQSFTAPWPGVWAVIVTQNNCTDTSRCIGFGPNAVNEISSSDIQIYPNPNKGSFIVSRNNYEKAIQLHIFDMLGREIHTQIMNDKQSCIALPKTASGMFLIYFDGLNKPIPVLVEKNK